MLNIKSPKMKMHILNKHKQVGSFDNFPAFSSQVKLSIISEDRGDLNATMMVDDL